MTSGIYKNKQGFIALFSVVLIGAFLSTMPLAHTLKAYSVRNTLSSLEDKLQTNRAAASCVELAKLKIIQYSFTSHLPYQGNEYISSERIACFIQTISYQGNQAQIQTIASSSKSLSSVQEIFMTISY